MKDKKGTGILVAGVAATAAVVYFLTRRSDNGGGSGSKFKVGDYIINKSLEHFAETYRVMAVNGDMYDLAPWDGQLGTTVPAYSIEYIDDNFIKTTVPTHRFNREDYISRAGDAAVFKVTGVYYIAGNGFQYELFVHQPGSGTSWGQIFYGDIEFYDGHYEVMNP